MLLCFLFFYYFSMWFFRRFILCSKENRCNGQVFTIHMRSRNILKAKACVLVKKIKKSYCSKPASFLFCEIFNTVKIKDNYFIDKVNANIYGLRTKDSEKC